LVGEDIGCYADDSSCPDTLSALLSAAGDFDNYFDLYYGSLYGRLRYHLPGCDI